MLNHESLDVYQASTEFLAFAHRVLKGLLRGHAALADQLRRAALSIPLNIAEGTGKRSSRERSRYYAIARGSAMECGALCDALSILELIDRTQHATGKELVVRIVSMLTKMMFRGPTR